MRAEDGRETVAVVGVTAWGLTLTQHLARAGVAVKLLARDQQEATLVRRHGTHPTRAEAVRLPPETPICADAAEALSTATIVLMVVPAQSMRANLRRIVTEIAPGAILVSAAKGLEISTGRRMTEVLAEEAAVPAGAVAALSGPNLAAEIACGLPATAVIASVDPQAAARVQRVINTPLLRVYSHDDVVGVELGGALKNIIALGAGINDGLGFGDNAKAALITRGLAEISRLGVALGANPLTFAGLSGLGDLIATCASPLSRNRTVGEQLGRGEPLALILERLGHIAEGVPTTAATHALAAHHAVRMPIVEAMHRVLFEGLSPAEAARDLMQREPRPELPL